MFMISTFPTKNWIEGFEALIHHSEVSIYTNIATKQTAQFIENVTFEGVGGISKC